MIIYNVTVSIEKEIEEDWIKWMREVHIPDVEATGYFQGHRLCRVIGGDEMGVTYAVQYLCESLARLQQYEIKHAATLREDYKKRYGGKYAAFRTLLEIIE
jgi:hypothetical protein